MDSELHNKSNKNRAVSIHHRCRSRSSAAVRQTYENTYSVHCIFHISENLPKNLKSKLHDQYKNFVHDFFFCCNSLCEEGFYERWARLTEKYSTVKDYLMRVLYPSRQAWA